MKTRLLLLGAVCAVVPSVALGYAFKLTNAGANPRWPDGATVTFTLGSDRPSNIAAGTDVEGALQAGAAVWEESSGVHVEITAGGAGLELGQDGANVITFADTQTNRDTLGEFHGVTLFWYQGPTMVEADMAYRTDNITFGDGSSDTNVLDLQGLMAHECGHALGMEHSGLQAATMFPYGGVDQLWRRVLDVDDLNGARQLYGLLLAGTGEIAGTITVNGTPAYQAQVVAEQNGLPVAASITLQDGAYAITGLPPGNYAVYAEPLDGPMTDVDLVGGAWDMPGSNGPFTATYANSGNMVAVTANQTVTVNIAAAPGATLNGLYTMPAFAPNNFNGRGPWAVSYAPGDTEYLAVLGEGVNTVGDNGFGVGDGISFTAVNSRGVNTMGTPYAILTVQVDGNAVAGSRTVYLSSGSGLAMLTGALIVRDCNVAGGVDPDSDGVCGAADNCPDFPNSAQEDRDGDNTGDWCDICPDDPSTATGPCGGTGSSSGGGGSSVGASSRASSAGVSSSRAGSSSAGGASSNGGSSAAGSSTMTVSSSAPNTGSSTTNTSGGSSSSDGGGDEGDGTCTCAVPGVGTPWAVVAMLVWAGRARRRRR